MKVAIQIVFYALLCFLGISSPILSLLGKSVTVWDSVYLKFYGVASENTFSLLSYLFYIIVFMGYVYLFQLYITSYVSERLYYIAIRYQTLTRWFMPFGYRIGLGAVVWLIFILFLTIVVGIPYGHTLEMKITVQPNVSVYQVLYQFLVNGWFQIMNGILITFIGAWLFKDGAFSLITIGVLVLTALPMLNVGGWLPSGLNSMGYISSHWEELFRITKVYIVYSLIETGVIIYLLKKVKFKN
ncbi:hypothetical protein D3C74_247530 [compost metagenome]